MSAPAATDASRGKSALPEVLLRPGREKSLLRRHPWVFSGAVAAAPDLPPGEPVAVRASDGRLLATGFLSPASQLRVRVLSFDESTPADLSLVRRRVEAAAALRAPLWDAQRRSAMRLVHGESDGLPGFVADRYGPVICVQLLCAGFQRLRDAIGPMLLDLFPDVSAVIERPDAKALAREGLPPRQEAELLAARPGADTAAIRRVLVNFGGSRRLVDTFCGQKTGAYLDQAENQIAVGALASGRDVLDVFCCDGGFTLACLRGGAKSVLSVDSSAPALEALAENLALNGLDGDTRCETTRADAFEFLRKLRDSRLSFDLIVLDPPKLAETKVRAEKACRAYKDLNLLCFKLLRPGGLLATFSCSGAVDPALFRAVVAEAACDAGRDAKTIRFFSQSPDHPVALSFPEGLYLKGLLCAV